MPDLGEYPRMAIVTYLDESIGNGPSRSRDQPTETEVSQGNCGAAANQVIQYSEMACQSTLGAST